LIGATVFYSFSALGQRRVAFLRDSSYWPNCFNPRTPTLNADFLQRKALIELFFRKKVLNLRKKENKAFCAPKKGSFLHFFEPKSKMLMQKQGF